MNGTLASYCESITYALMRDDDLVGLLCTSLTKVISTTVQLA